MLPVPWAVMFDRLALFGFVEMTFFLAIFIVGCIYVWNRGALHWD
ncbi:MAG TPA: NADH-quinone oxidoreductase subunit A [Thermoanaerobaculia bacterium]|nr:NADH-quinone oxidoreductase subunit A [Thermoanaerobaculia bacterium]